MRIFTVNDVYAQSPSASGGKGGWAELGSLLAAERARAEASNIPSFFVVAGDFLGGSALGEAFEGAHVAAMFDILAPDAVVLGNHEFDFGETVLSSYMDAASYPWLGTNVFLSPTSPPPSPTPHPPPPNPDQEPEERGLTQGWEDLPLLPGAAESTVWTVPPVPGVDGPDVRIGLIGLCTPATPHLSFPGENVVFADPIAVGAAAASRLKHEENVDAVFALTHLREAGDVALAKAVPELRLLLGGHDHSPMLVVEDETLLLKTGMDNHYLGIVDVVFYRNDDDNELEMVFSPALKANVGYPPAPEILEVLDHYRSDLAARVEAEGGNEVLFSIPPGCVLDTRSEFIRRSEAPICNLIADALHAYFAPQGAVGGIINGGFVRGNTVYSGPRDMTLGDIKYELPFPKTIALAELTPHVFKSALEQMLSNAPDAAGSYPHLSSSLSMEYDTSRPVGDRVLSISLSSFPLDLSPDNTDTYLITITSFMAVGGDSVDSWLRANIVNNLDLTMTSPPTIADLFTDYLRTVGSHLDETYFAPKSRVQDLALQHQ